MTKRYLKTPEEVIDALQDGKEIHDSEGRVWKLYNGCAIRKDKSGFWSVNTPINAHFDGLYAYDTEPLKLEVGKFYKTRDGRKAWIVEGTMDDTFPFRVAAQKEYAVYTVTEEGKCFSEDMSGSDLVAPWEEAE